MIKLRLFLCLFFSIVFCGCVHNAHKQQALRRVAQHEVEPADAFLQGHMLYIQYDFQGESFFFAADLNQVQLEGNVHLARLEPLRIKNPERLDHSRRVVIVGREWTEVLKRTIAPLVPPREGQGVLLCS